MKALIDIIDLNKQKRNTLLFILSIILLIFIGQGIMAHLLNDQREDANRLNFGNKHLIIAQKIVNTIILNHINESKTNEMLQDIKSNLNELDIFQSSLTPEEYGQYINKNGSVRNKYRLEKLRTSITEFSYMVNQYLSDSDFSNTNITDLDRLSRDIAVQISDISDSMLYEYQLTNTKTILFGIVICIITIVIIGFEWYVFIIPYYDNSISSSTDDYTSKEHLMQITGHHNDTVDELRHTIINLRATRKLLIKNIDTKEKIYTILTHDIKNMLTAMSLNVEVLKLGDRLNEQRKAAILHTHEDYVKNCSKLLVDMIEFFKGDMVSELEIKELDLDLLIKDLVHSFKKEINDKEIDIEIEVDKSIDSIQSNQVFLSTIIRNIFHNALKFNKQNGHIFISITQVNNYNTFTITDSGVGMNSTTVESLNKVTNKGKVNNSTNLGMVIIYKMVERLNGKITVDSELGRGSTFTVKLPKLSNTEEYSEQFNEEIYGNVSYN